MDGGSPELLSPAGTLKNLRYALAYGADAIYAGVPRYSLRVRNNDFRGPEQVGEGIRLAHAAGRKFLLAVNALPHGAKLRTFIADMEPLIEQGPDALIMADPRLIHLMRQRWLEQAIYPSRIGFPPRCMSPTPTDGVAPPRHRGRYASSARLAGERREHASLTGKPIRDGYSCR